MRRARGRHGRHALIPSPLVLLVLALAALRTWRLLALDTLPVLVWLRDRAVGYQAPVDRATSGRTLTEGRITDWDDGAASTARPLLAEWLQCPWCSGLWLAAGWYAAWAEEPRDTIYAACALAMSTVVGVIQSLLPD